MADEYRNGKSIHQLANSTGRSYGYVRNRLLQLGVPIRSVAEGTRLFVKLHPSWAEQFLKYRVLRQELSDRKIRLVAMVITEGYVDPYSVGFTNTQQLLSTFFEELSTQVYPGVHVARSGILSRIHSKEIASDISNLMDGKSFADHAFQFLIGSTEAILQVLRIVADTEGSILVSLRKARHNYTVECRIVLASTHAKFKAQLQELMGLAGIKSVITKNGVEIRQKREIVKFIERVGFTRGVRVVRRKASKSTWYGKEKQVVGQLAIRIYSRQSASRRSNIRGVFAECKTRLELLSKLMTWYDEVLQEVGT